MEYKYIKWDKFNPIQLDFYQKGKQFKLEVAKNYMSLDTETSTTEDKSMGWIYQWCFSYPSEDPNIRYLVYGRRPTELTTALTKIHFTNQLSKDRRLILYVHNLSYDETYFHRFLEEGLQSLPQLIAAGAHRIISYNLDGLEFRDSLKLSQKSLYSWSKELVTKHQKLKGLIDYSKTRYQDSPLYKNDWRYMFYDVITLDECIEKQLLIHEDKIWTIPLTITGYARRSARKQFQKDYRSNREYFENKKLSYKLYSFMRAEFAGALTHGNRFYMDTTVILSDLIKKLQRHDIRLRHRDFVSHYPSQQRCKWCPSGRFRLKYTRKDKATIPDLDDIFNKGFCFLADITFKDLRIKPGITLPYAQVSKFYDGKLERIQLNTDNGRILQMDGAAHVVVNELDLKWLRKQYTFDYIINEVYIAKRGKYPKYLRDTVDMFFEGKSYTKKIYNDILKTHSEFSIEAREAKRNNLRDKGLLNAIYGMSATDPVRENYTENEDGIWERELLTEKDIADKLDEFYSKKSSFMNYELGLWTTAHARDELLTFVEVIGYENFLYGDTDSIFYISTPEVEERIENFNRQFREEADRKGFYITVGEKKVYYHQFEDEGEDIIEFRFLHSKCYAYVTADGKLHTTIAGVKDVGRKGNNRSRELGHIDNLTAGTIFKDCGGTIIKYNPKGSRVDPRVEEIDGHMIELSQWAIITESTKELHDALEQKEITEIFEEAYYGED